MGMKRIYSISSNIYSNVCESDDRQDIAKWLMEQAEKLPLGTVIVIRVNEIPEELWNGFPKFEGFKHNNQEVE